MLKKLLLVPGIVVMFVMPAAAQQTDTPIEYGQTVTGEITNRQFEIPYVFTAEKDETIVVEMGPVEILGDLSDPTIILLDENFETLSSSTGFLGDAVLVATIPDSGTFYILATRGDGRAGDSVGEYWLTLHKPEIMEFNGTLEASVTNEETDYFIVQTTEPFSIEYIKTSGEFGPSVSITYIDEFDDLSELATLSGNGLVRGVIQADPIRGVDTYIVTVSEALFDYNFQEVSANYTLTMSPAK